MVLTFFVPKSTNEANKVDFTAMQFANVTFQCMHTSDSNGARIWRFIPLKSSLYRLWWRAVGCDGFSFAFSTQRNAERPWNTWKGGCDAWTAKTKIVMVLKTNTAISCAFGQECNLHLLFLANRVPHRDSWRRNGSATMEQEHIPGDVLTEKRSGADLEWDLNERKFTSWVISWMETPANIGIRNTCLEGNLLEYVQPSDSA